MSTQDEELIVMVPDSEAVSTKFWCALCGKWGDHQSGSCPELAQCPDINYPAIWTVHIPSGAIDACDKHATKLMRLMHFCSVHSVKTQAPEGAQCTNCINEAKRLQKEQVKT